MAFDGTSSAARDGPSRRRAARWRASGALLALAVFTAVLALESSHAAAHEGGLRSICVLCAASSHPRDAAAPAVPAPADDVAWWIEPEAAPRPGRTPAIRRTGRSPPNAATGSP